MLTSINRWKIAPGCPMRMLVHDMMQHAALHTSAVFDVVIIFLVKDMGPPTGHKSTVALRKYPWLPHSHFRHGSWLVLCKDKMIRDNFGPRTSVKLFSDKCEFCALQAVNVSCALSFKYLTEAILVNGK